MGSRRLTISFVLSCFIYSRFAPSPTGFLHIGGARTALFNWMYTKAQQGKFVLRVEDTDRERSKKEYVDEILESMSWLGLSWDEIYYQSKRFDIYTQHAQKLLKEHKAYKEGDAIILKMPQKELKLYDLIRGEIQFDSETLKDQVLMKSDGSPTYSFACVVDDNLMEISHIIRGEDHISNTPKQMIIYEALGWKLPKYAHLPLIMGSDGARLSKRTGAVAVTDYKNDGFLPNALLNYLMLLGWSPGENQELISLDSAIKKFSIKKVNKAAAVFSMDKLRWVNQEYMKQLKTKEIVNLLLPILKEKSYIDDNYDMQALESIVNLYKGRFPTLLDFVDRAGYFFVDKISVSNEVKEKYFSEDRTEPFVKLSEALSQIQDYNAATSEETFRNVVKALGLSPSDLVHPVRVALTGHDVGPGLFETMAVLGKDKTIQRLQAVSS